MNAPVQGDGQRGQVLALFAICLVAIVAMTGLVIDGGMTFTQRRDQQNVADAAAMAGAYAFANTSNAGAAVTQGMNTAAANGYTHGVDGTLVNVQVSVSNGLATVTANVTKPHRNYFSGIVGFGSWDVSASARAIAGLPNAAIGAMPILFNKRAFPGAHASSTDIAFDEPGTGTEDVPQGATQFNWTVYCTASGNACNGNTSTVSDLINGTGKDTEVTLNDKIGPLNAGDHAALFNDLSAKVPSDFPVAIVDDDGAMVGWAMFHLSGSVGGSTKHIQGHFVSPVNEVNFKVVNNGGKATGNFGETLVQLTN